MTQQSNKIYVIERRHGKEMAPLIKHCQKIMVSFLPSTEVYLCEIYSAEFTDIDFCHEDFEPPAYITYNFVRTITFRRVKLLRNPDKFTNLLFWKIQNTQISYL